MKQAVDLAEVAALVGDPSRANMLSALIGGRALTSGELAQAAGVTPATASSHLAKLEAGRLLVHASQGRHRYYRLASPAVARMLEGIMVIAARSQARPRATPRIDPALRAARTCYDHLAGWLGVALADALIERGALILTQEAGELTLPGRELLAGLGVVLPDRSRSRRVYCRPCLDWSERRPHLAGVVGAALLTRALELGWIHRAAGRAVTVTPLGWDGLSRAFGLQEPAATPAGLKRPLTARP